MMLIIIIIIIITVLGRMYILPWAVNANTKASFVLQEAGVEKGNFL
jgi:hypothetical protein